MKRRLPTDDRIAARLAIIELRCLLAADSFIGVSRRKKLVHQASGLLKDTAKRELFIARLTTLIIARFGRNPDNCQVAPATLHALRLLDELQEGRRP